MEEVINLNIIYEGMDISDSIEVLKADIYDNAGGIADNVELVLSDTIGLWSKWKPKKGDKIEVINEDFSSGMMFIDYLEQIRGEFIIKAISLPPKAKTPNTKLWENIRLLKLAEEIANKYGFILQTYGVKDWQYCHVDQIEQPDFEFLAYRCLLEGYMLKICNNKIIIYDERTQEQQDAIITVNMDDIDGSYNFKSISTGLFKSCLVYCSTVNGLIKSSYEPLHEYIGPVLKRNIYVDNHEEANRFAKGLLRAVNKNESTGRVQIKFNSELAAGSNLYIDQIGFGDGKYFIEQIVHRLTEGKSLLRLRRPLEEY